MSNKIRGRDKFSKYKYLINLLISFFRIFPKNFRVKLFDAFRMTNGVKGLAIRYILLKSIAKKIGSNVAIYPSVYLLNPNNLSVGSNVSIHPMCYIESLGGVEIGNDVSIAHGTTIMSTSHIFSDLGTPIKNQGLEMTPVLIKDNVWIGAKATILGKLIIEKGAIIAAGAVVTRDVQEDNVVGGVPAIPIKKRGNE